MIVPAGHPLEKVQPVTLQALARYPIVTYHEGLTGRAKVDRSFADAGLAPDIVMSALDADVIKTYVELGMGIGMPRLTLRPTALAKLQCPARAVLSGFQNKAAQVSSSAIFSGSQIRQLWPRSCRCAKMF